MLIRSVRLVPVGRGSAPTWGGEPVDLRLADGQVTHVGPTLVPDAAERVLEVDGRWVIPGLWDAHTTRSCGPWPAVVST
ncbi:MAG TPA: hypothetical protein PLX71_02600 [Phycicoccus sp.]|nr:hypothetical protein [Phycicoccus sp.]